jgi:hypothetical protein
MLPPIQCGERRSSTSKQPTEDVGWCMLGNFEAVGIIIKQSGSAAYNYGEYHLPGNRSLVYSITNI